jgi:exosome complex RNA-binding protein Rrp4
MAYLKRRKLKSDELQMRGFFEGDLVVAEVLAFFSDGTHDHLAATQRTGRHFHPHPLR